MKTPEEIKKGLKACGDGCCSACTYWDDCDPDDHHVALVTDALAYIEQLEEVRKVAVEEMLAANEMIGYIGSAMMCGSKIPTADAVEVIRCGDCEHYVKSPFGHAKLGWCKIDGKHRSREFYCAHADRRGANEET